MNKNSDFYWKIRFFEGRFVVWEDLNDPVKEMNCYLQTNTNVESEFFTNSREKAYGIIKEIRKSYNDAGIISPKFELIMFSLNEAIIYTEKINN